MMLFDKRASLGLILLIDLIIGMLGYTARFTAAILEGRGSLYAHPAALSVACTVAICALVVHVSLWIGLTLTVVESRPAALPVAVPLPAAVFEQSADVHQAVDPTRMVIHTAAGGVFLTITREQLSYIAARLRTGKDNVPVNIYGKGTPFERPEVERLRTELVDTGLAMRTRGKQVLITGVGKAALVRTAAALPKPR